ncbi:glycoside hydrolase family 127 protein [Fibrisoma montanum]|uniref:Glycoside hydrolase family 127 protein n=1 Tax=Fibrisoma montanum TaxID=2305895 RepID=A0A418M2H8_9BACT|nr:glycoside hydrolase family 127 protein [Fibrisoma montanum]RIV19921.1 glycoside hydrolase family 127 protein [Fibrisoma montanum]
MTLRTLLFSLSCLSVALPVTAQDYPIVPVAFTNVKINGGFWQPRLETNRTVTIPFDFKKCEETGRIDNFAVAGGLKKGTFRGIRYDDSDVFKVVEGAAYSLQTHYDPTLDNYLDTLISYFAAAQEADGYLYTIRTILKDSTAKKDRDAGATRFSFMAGSHELYNVGHMYEAAVAHFQATGKRTFLNVALKNADYLMRTIGPDKLIVVPGHQEIEIGLVKLYRVTNDKRYLDFARFLLDMRGRSDKRALFPDPSRTGNGSQYLQDHQPVTQQREAVGHAVRAGYMYAAMTDIAAMQQDKAYLDALTAIWNDVVERKQYLTGGLGAREHGEAFGNAYELPNDVAYAETCAAVANLLWNHRMFLLTGQSKYMDVFERVLYNGFLAGVSLEGDKFFYVNPLASDGKRKFNVGVAAERAPWFGTSCCPTNVVRFLPSLPGYVYAVKNNDVFVNLFLSNTSNLTVGKTPVQIQQQTNYPWDGAVTMTVSPRNAQAFDLLVRIPGWTLGKPMPGSLYSYVRNIGATPTLTVNGKAVPVKIDNGYARISRTWKPGDRVALRMEMPVREVMANQQVKDDAGRVAIERGPIVYCAEAADNGGKALDLTVAAEQTFTPVVEKDKLGGITALKSGNLTLIPYYAWAHRGPNEMAVWFGQTRR